MPLEVPVEEVEDVSYLVFIDRIDIDISGFIFLFRLFSKMD